MFNDTGKMVMTGVLNKQDIKLYVATGFISVKDTHIFCI